MEDWCSWSNGVSGKEIAASRYGSSGYGLGAINELSHD
jgi:hypothetical protein